MASVFGGGGVSRAGVGAMLHPGYPAGGFQVMFEGGVASAAIAAVDSLLLYPFVVYAPITVTSILERVQTVGAGSSVKCAVWRNSQTSARPTGLPILGQNDGYDTATGTGIKSAAISSVSLTPGVWWAGSVATGTLPAMVCAAASAAYPIPVGTAADAIPGPAIMVTGMSTAVVYATDIMSVDLTSASFSRTSAGVPIIGLGWA